MRFFIDSSTGDGLEGDDVKVKVTNCYIELEYSMDDEVYLVQYFVPRSETSFFVATCWDDTFDSLLDGVEDEDDLETLVDTWPLLGELLANGMADKYSNGALIKLEDPDTGEPKWFVASVIGNLRIDDLDDLFNDRTAKVSQLVMTKSAELMGQLQENKPSLLRAVGKGIAAGVAGVLLGGLTGLFGDFDV